MRLSHLINYMKKKEYEKIQKKEKVKTILKWVFACLGWTLLATATISLMVVGIRGCSNSQKNTTTSNRLVNKEAQPSSIVYTNRIGNGLDNVPDDMGYNLLQGTGGYTLSGDLSLSYHWNNYDTPGSSAPWRGQIMPYFAIWLSDNVETYRLFTLSLTDSYGVTSNYNVYRVSHEEEHEEVVFSHYTNGSYGTVTIDDRDFEYDAYTDVSITFPRYNAEWVRDSASYMVTVSFVYYIYDSTYWGSSHVNSRLGSFSDMFQYRTQYVNQLYGWLSVSSNQGSNEAGGNTNIGGSGGDNASGGLFGVFNLLSLAFSSIASLLAVTIIPGVTIGTLFVLPLVVTLIIFIVSLFKR